MRPKNLFHRLNCVFERLGQTCKKFSEDSCCEEIEFFFCQEVDHSKYSKGSVNYQKDSFKMKLSKINY